MYQRNTLQRKLILETVRKLKNHPTADEVYVELVKEYPSISRTTVYRDLHELGESGEILHVGVVDGADHYDHNVSKHYHIRCQICGRVEDVVMPEQDLINQVTDTCGFEIVGVNVVFSGICPNCKEKRS